MECTLCGKSTMVYTGMLNPWHECRNCGALYCDSCSRGQESGAGYVTVEDLYQVSRTKSCPRCDNQIYKK